MVNFQKVNLLITANRSPLVILCLGWLFGKLTSWLTISPIINGSYKNGWISNLLISASGLFSSSLTWCRCYETFFFVADKGKMSAGKTNWTGIISTVDGTEPFPSVRVPGWANGGFSHRDKPRVCTRAKMFPHLKLIYFIISVYGPHSYFWHKAKKQFLDAVFTIKTKFWQYYF